MRRYLVCICGSIVGSLTYIIGGWDIGTQTLLWCVVIDFLTGLACAFLQRSAKSESGGVNSHVCYLGIVKKFSILLIVGLAARLGGYLGLDYLREVVLQGFVIEESISIIENGVAIGIPVPRAVGDFLDMLKKKGR